jgi:hypothetical protein
MRATFAVATAAIAINVVVEALSPEPGTGITDRALATIVPLVVLAIAARGYPRLRPGWRAAIALSLGALALVGGAVALDAARVEGVGPSVISGLALLPAGFALLVLGAGLLWQSRRRDGRRVLRRVAITIGALLFAFEVLTPIGFAIVATNRPAEAPVDANLGRPYEEVLLETSDGLELAAWWIPSKNGAAVITFPDRTWTPTQSRLLAEHGFGVLALDMRGYGASEGEPNAYGWGATPDLDAAVDFVAAQPSVDPGGVGALGLSVGGEVVLEAAADNPGLRAVVSEGAGERSVRETVLYGPAAALVLPQMAVQTAAVSLLSGDLPPPSLGDVTGSVAPGAVFLIHAEHGAGGEELNREYFERARDPKQIWEVPGATHTEGLEAEPAEYERRVIGFFARYLRSEDE